MRANVCRSRVYRAKLCFADAQGALQVHLCSIRVPTTAKQASQAGKWAHQFRVINVVGLFPPRNRAFQMSAGVMTQSLLA
jgi:hypothetical protein